MAELVKLQINGKKIEVPEGITIIEAALKAKIKIPYLCYCPGLESIGACRVCVVKLEGSKELVASCARKVKEGMVIWTDTERVRGARRFVIDLILSNHPAECLSCEKNGDCELQKYAYELGIPKTQFTRKDADYPIENDNPFIERNHNLCILCGRCIRICKAQGADILDFTRRGMLTKVTTPLDKNLVEAGCDFCGSCVAVCPVAALVEKPRKSLGREWEFKKVKSVCSYCGCGCDLYLETVDGKIVRAATEQKTDYLCAKGRFGWDYVENPERLRTPLIRKDGKLVECSWDEALSYVAERLTEIKKTQGAKSLGGLISAYSSNETIYLFQKLMRECLGTNNIDSSVSILAQPAASLFIDALGSVPTVTFEDVESADVILVVGTDASVSVPALDVSIRKAVKRGANLITIDSMVKETEGALHLKVKPGREGLALSAIAQVMLNKGFYNEDFTKAKISNLAEFKKLVSEKAKGVKESGVSNEEIEKVAELYGDINKKAVIIFSPEKAGLGTVNGILNLLLLTGRIEKGVLPAMLVANLRGAIELGAMPDCLPGYQAAGEVGLSALEMLTKDSPILGMYIVGGNPAVSFPDTKAAKEALASLDFLVVEDIFLTETANLAHVVLPGLSFAETTGTVKNMEGKIKEFNQAISNKGKVDWEIIVSLSKELGCPLKYLSEGEIRKGIETVLLEAKKKAKEKGKFALGLAVEDALPKTNEKYPFVLMTGSSKFKFYDGIRSNKSKLAELEGFKGSRVKINPEDAHMLGIEEGAEVIVSTEKGKISGIAQIDPSLPQGAIWMAVYSKEVGALIEKELPCLPTGRDSLTKTRKVSLLAANVSLAVKQKGEK